jgi:hypothetical protein
VNKLERHLIETLEELILHLKQTSLDSVGNEYRRYSQIDRLYENAMRSLFPDAYRHLGLRSGAASSLHDHLNQLEKKLDQLCRNDYGPCNFSQQGAERFPQFMTALSDMKAQSEGKETFVESFKDWFSTKQRGVIVDPHIFKLADENESKYCKGIINILGGTLDRIDIYYSVGDYVPSVAKKIFAALNKTKIRDFNFYACPNIHDRVWMRHYQVNDTPTAKGWEARVVGASVNGISRRPTYVVDMTPADAADYSKYLGNLRNGAGGGSVIPASKTPPI